VSLERRNSVLIVEDDDAYRSFLVAEMGELGYQVYGEADGRRALARLEAEAFDVVLMDLRLPGLDGMAILREVRRQGIEAQVVMLTGHGSIDTAIEAMKLGAYDYLTKPCDIEEMRAVVERAREHAELARENTALRAILRRREGAAEMVGRSATFRAMLDRINRIGPTETIVLILGESGTGKELAAQMLHRLSARADRPFVDINCGAMQETLFESEFFGHEKGSFTGAGTQKPGLVEAANGGTLFLDEVSEMPAAAQVKLLRFLETGQFRRLGGVRNLSADVRVIAASNRPLETFASEGGFRQDLYFRLAVFTVQVPALRNRPGDAILLADYFTRYFNARTGRRIAGLDDEATRAVEAYSWPGNVRELRNAIESAVILSDGKLIRLHDLPAHVVASAVRGGAASGFSYGVGEGPIPTLAEVERRHIEAVLARHGGHRDRTARSLGIATKTLYRKLREYGVADSATGHTDRKGTV
jgi:DNA-binding NtrC family response regulator